MAKSQELLSKFFKNKKQIKCNLLKSRRESIDTTKLILKENSENLLNNSIYFIPAGMQTSARETSNIELFKTDSLKQIKFSEHHSFNTENQMVPKQNNKLLHLLQKQKSTNMTGMSSTSKSDEEMKKPKIFTEDYKNCAIELALHSQYNRDSCSDNKTPSFKERLETENSKDRDCISSIGDCIEYVDEKRSSSSLVYYTNEKVIFSQFEKSCNNILGIYN